MNRFFFVLSAIILIVIGLVSVGLLLWKRSGGTDVIPSTNQGMQTTSTTTTVTPSGDTEPPAPIPPVPSRPEAEVMRENFIRSFVERYGSYSTDAPFENLRRTFADMTERFRKEEEKKIKPVTGKGTYYGVTVRVQSVEVVEDTSTRVRANVAVQWEEEKGTTEPQLSRRRMEITLVQESGSWRVDRTTWK